MQRDARRVLPLLLRGSAPARRLRLSWALRLRYNPLRQFLPPRLAIPFLEGLIGDFSFDKQLREFATLRLTLEWHAPLSVHLFATNPPPCLADLQINPQQSSVQHTRDRCERSGRDLFKASPKVDDGEPARAPLQRAQ
jgi:hypothetical protein